MKTPIGTMQIEKTGIHATERMGVKGPHGPLIFFPYSRRIRVILCRLRPCCRNLLLQAPI